METTYKLTVLGCKENTNRNILRKKLERSMHSDSEKVRNIIDRILSGESFTLFDHIHQVSAMTYQQQFEEMGINCQIEESLGLLPQREEYVCPACGHLQAVSTNGKDICSKCGTDRVAYETYLKNRDIIRAERVRIAVKKQFDAEGNTDEEDAETEKFRQKVRKLLEKQYRVKLFGERYVVFTGITFLSSAGGLLLIAAAAGVLHFYFSWQLMPNFQTQPVATVERIIDLSPLNKTGAGSAGQSGSPHASESDPSLSELRNPYADVGAKMKRLGMDTDTAQTRSLSVSAGNSKNEPANVQIHINLAMYHATAGDFEQAYRYLARATDIVNMMDDDMRRSVSDAFNKNRVAVLTKIIKQKVASGYAVSAEDRSNLTGIVEMIADPAEQAQAFSCLGMLFDNPKKTSGQRFFDLALRDAEAVSDSQKRVATLSFIAGNMVKAGYGREADDLFGKALALNKKILDVGAQATGLSIIARGMAEAGNTEGARNILTGALNAFAVGDRSSSGARLSSEFKKNYVFTLGVVAKNLTLKGHREKAKEEFFDALVQANRIDNAEDRAQALLHLAAQVAEAGDSLSATDIAAHVTGPLQ